MKSCSELLNCGSTEVVFACMLDNQEDLKEVEWHLRIVARCSHGRNVLGPSLVSFLDFEGNRVRDYKLCEGCE